MQLLTLAAEAETDKPATGRYFSLFLNHLTHVTANTVGAQQNYYGGSCFEWGVPAEVLEERIQDALNMTYRNLTVAHPQITVARSGFGDGSTAWGYTYELDFPDGSEDEACWAELWLMPGGGHTVCRQRSRVLGRGKLVKDWTSACGSCRRRTCAAPRGSSSSRWASRAPSRSRVAPPRPYPPT